MKGKRVSVVWSGLGAILLSLTLAACDQPEPVTEGGPPVTRRLTQVQYRQIISDVFGPGIQIAGRLDPDVRKDGLIGIGATAATVTPGSLEQYDALARAIAAEVLQPKYRRAFMSCAPESETAADAACAAQTLKEAGRYLFRRPLTAQELNSRVALATASSEKLNDFYKGLEAGIASLLVSPSFLFQRDILEPDPDNRGSQRLDAYSKASRLSFFLWNTAPDEILLTAAEKGDLHTDAGLRREVERMVASPRLEEGVRGFFGDFLQFTQFDALIKDSIIYPKFSPAVAIDAREQTLRTVVDHLVTQGADYRDLFTTRKTFMSRPLGVVYQVPVPAEETWMPYAFPEGDPRAGLLTQLSFTAVYAHPGRSSATLRGKAIREMLMCQPVPSAPANVDFTNFEELSKPGHNTTARERLTSHMTSPVCAGCHKITDPIGLALEHFDGAGALRTAENGKDIDTSGEIDGAAFTDAATLGRALRNDPQIPACLIDKLVAYGSGRKAGPNDEAWMTYLQQGFAADGYNVPHLMQRIALSDALYRIKPVAQDEAASDNAAKGTGS